MSQSTLVTSSLGRVGLRASGHKWRVANDGSDVEDQEYIPIFGGVAPAEYGTTRSELSGNPQSQWWCSSGRRPIFGSGLLVSKA